MQPMIHIRAQSNLLRLIIAKLMIGTLFLLLLTACTLPAEMVEAIPPQEDQTPVAEEAAADEAEATAVAEEEGEADSEETTAEEDAGDSQESAMAADGETYNGIPVGFTAEGLPYRGSPDAPITMYEYSDYQCPFCNRYFVQTEPAINEAYVRNGQVRVVFSDFPLVQLHPNAPGAHMASICVAEQGAELYWEMHSQLFRTQSTWSQDPAALDFFASLAEESGADMDAYELCMGSGAVELELATRVNSAQELGFSGTPSFQFVNEQSGETFDLVGAQPFDQFAEWIDAIAAGEAPQTAEAEGAPPSDIPFWATAEGLSPDPDRPGRTMAGDFYRGNIDAEVIVIEYSDFQCPYCKRHTETTQPILDAEFVESDEVLWVFKHFPLSIHAQAPAAGAAAECAADQGAFWEMHETLFANMSSWSISEPNDIFSKLAGNLGLDVDAFNACLQSGSGAQEVQSDMADGAPFVRGTPTFIILFNGEGSIIPGALPAERFIETIQGILDQVGTN